MSSSERLLGGGGGAADTRALLAEDVEMSLNANAPHHPSASSSSPSAYPHPSPALVSNINPTLATITLASIVPTPPLSFQSPAKPNHRTPRRSSHSHPPPPPPPSAPTTSVPPLPLPSSSSSFLSSSHSPKSATDASHSSLSSSSSPGLHHQVDRLTLADTTHPSLLLPPPSNGAAPSAHIPAALLAHPAPPPSSLPHSSSHQHLTPTPPHSSHLPLSSPATKRELEADDQGPKKRRLSEPGLSPSVIASAMASFHSSPKTGRRGGEGGGQMMALMQVPTLVGGVGGGGGGEEGHNGVGQHAGQQGRVQKSPPMSSFSPPFAAPPISHAKDGGGSDHSTAAQPAASQSDPQPQPPPPPPPAAPSSSISSSSSASVPSASTSSGPSASPFVHLHLRSNRRSADGPDPALKATILPHTFLPYRLLFPHGNPHASHVLSKKAKRRGAEAVPPTSSRLLESSSMDFDKALLPPSSSSPASSPSPQPPAGPPLLHPRAHLLLLSLTCELPELYSRCNPAFTYSRQANPRRVLTEPSERVGNGGFDNAHANLVLSVNDVLHSDSGLFRSFRVLELLGEGTFGQVVKCEDCASRVLRAVKVIKNKPAYYNQALMEIRLLSTLNSQYDPDDRHHMLRLLDHFTYKHHLCLVFELLSVNLYELIKQNQVLFAPHACTISCCSSPVQPLTAAVLSVLPVPWPGHAPHPHLPQAAHRRAHRAAPGVGHPLLQR